MMVDTCLTAYTKINLKWIRSLKVRAETVEVLEENIEEKLYDMVLAVISCVYYQKHKE